MLSSRATKTAKKKSVGLVSKKKQLCTCSTLFLYISLPLFCTTSSRNFQKLPSYTFLVILWPVHFFFRCRSFSPCWPLAFLLFLIAAINFQVFLPTKLVSLVFIPRSSFFSVIHVNVDIKISRRKESALLLLFLSQKVREGMRFTAETPGPWNAKVYPGLHEEVDVGTYLVRTIFSEPKFLGCINDQIFLTMVLRCARESSAIKRL